ncbi:ras guanine nucleotide exchange factor domain-containing protein [Phlyctochytrium arcticum]|nr:ras guanine nucleotide exchange factor domain-containing protein [Phlyctochytrium arcticum]
MGGSERASLKSLDDYNQRDSEGRTPLHVAAASSDKEKITVLLAESHIKVNIQDKKGLTPLHMAASGSAIGAVRLLVNAGANVNAVDLQGKRPVDYAKMPAIEMYLTDCAAITIPPVPPQRKSSHLVELEAELPEDIVTLKGFCIDLIISQTVFRERCKETIRQLIEEKHIALHKNRLFEQAAGIQDRETSDRFIDQLQYLQDENERQAATISYLKMSIQMFEHAAAQQDEYYRKNLADLSKQHNEQLQAIFRRNEETEKAFLAYQTSHADELAELAKLRSETNSKHKSTSSKGLPQEAPLLAEIQSLRKDLANNVAEKIALEERLKLSGKLKSLADEENNKLRNDILKLRKLMQEEILKQLQNARSEQDQADESTGNIVFTKGEGGQKRLKGATAEKLLERLVDPSVLDHHYQQTIFLTYKMFISSEKFLQTLINQYNEANAELNNLSDATRSSSPVIHRILNVLTFWVEHHWTDFADDENLLQMLERFVQDSQHDASAILSLRTIIQTKINLDSANQELDAATSAAPKPILPRALAKRYSSENALFGARPILMGSLGVGLGGGERPTSWAPFGGKGKLAEGAEEVKLKFAEMDPLEMARQLTLIEFEFFKSIRSREFLNLAWMKGSKETEAANILRMTRWSNHVVQWIVTEIVSLKESTKTRAATLERFIMMGHYLEKLQNFNGVKEIVAALQTASVYRLKKTKEAMGNKYLRIYDELARLVSSELNYKNMRAKVRASEPPLIPFPGLYQGDLVFLDTCYKDKLDGSDLVNYNKLESIAQAILELEAYQQVVYSLEPIQEMQDYIREHPLLDDDQAYNESLACEPKVSQ